MTADGPFPTVAGVCPACGTRALFVGLGGYISCSFIECPDPGYVTELLDGDGYGRGAVLDVLAERQRQDAKWGTSFPGRPHSHWLAIAAEELGEAAEAVCETEIPPVVQRTTTLSHLRREVIQLAAVALSWLEHGEWGSGRERSAE